jgi:prepilin-type N-terminal cleavage/methylation domain-containing protein
MSVSDAQAPAGHGGGFTLVEVLVATTILAVGIVGVMNGFSQSMRAGSKASRLEGAMDIAQKQISLAEASCREDLTPLAGSLGQYSWQMTVTDKPYGLVLVSVEVTWLQESQAQSFVLSEVIVPHSNRQATTAAGG